METYLMFYDANMLGMTPWTGERGGSERPLSYIGGGGVRLWYAGSSIHPNSLKDSYPLRYGKG